MIIKDLLDYLGTELSVGVYMEAPEAFTNYVLLEQTGTSRKHHIITTMVAVQSYAPSLYEAMVMNETVKAAMEGFSELPNVTRVDLQTDYNFTNTATKQYRWQAVYAITHY